MHPPVGHAVHIELAIDLAALSRGVLLDHLDSVNQHAPLAALDHHLNHVVRLWSNVEGPPVAFREGRLFALRAQGHLERVGVSAASPGELPRPQPEADRAALLEPQADNRAHIPTRHHASAEDIVVAGPDARHAQLAVLNAPVPAQHVPVRPDHLPVELVLKDGSPLRGPREGR